MIANLFALRRRQPPRDSTVLTDRRSGAPVTPRPARMPRMRWYS